MPLNAARAAGQGAQNTLIWTASVLTGIELTSAHNERLRVRVATATRPRTVIGIRAGA